MPRADAIAGAGAGLGLGLREIVWELDGYLAVCLVSMVVMRAGLERIV
jgi:hypothetical protein